MQIVIRFMPPRTAILEEFDTYGTAFYWE